MTSIKSSQLTMYLRVNAITWCNLVLLLTWAYELSTSKNGVLECAKHIYNATEYQFCNLIIPILFFWWPRLPTVSNQMHQYCHLSAKLSYLMLMTFDPCNDGLLVIFPGSEILEGIGSPARAYIWGCTSLRCSKAILPTPWLSILHPHFKSV